MAEVLRFKLKNGVRNPVDVDSETSVFCGRESDIKRFMHMITHRDSASVLVSGVRGVGKTSFVREVLRRIKHSEGIDLKTVYISLADISFEKPDELRLKILKVLIRALYFATDEKTRKEAELDSLYDKTYFTEITKQGLVEILDNKKMVERSLSSSEQKITISFSDNTLEVIRIALGSVLTGGGLVLGLANKLLLTIAGVGSMVVAIFVLLNAKISFGKKKENETTVTDELTKKTQDSGIAKLDLTADTLEHQFETALKSISKKEKIVFVIDELDKLASVESDDINDHGVYQVIKPLKNIFNLSKSIFIFVGAEDFYDKLEDQKREDPYGGTHTIFTDKIFLAGMYYDEIQQLIDNQKDGDLIVGGEEEYEKLKAYIAWQARNHVFDTYNLLEELTEYISTDEAYISIKEDDSDHKGNVDEYWDISAGFQLYLNSAFSYYQGITRSRLRERFYFTVREVAQKFYDDTNLVVRDGNYLNLLDENEQKTLKISDPYLTYEERQDLEGAIEDFLARTTRNVSGDFANVIQSVEKRENPDGSIVDVAVKKYQFGSVEFPYEIINQTFNDPLDFEKKFVDSLEAFSDTRKNLKSGKLTALDVYEKTFKRMDDISDRIANKERNREPKSEILKMTKELEGIVKNTPFFGFENLVESIVQKIGGVSSETDPSVVDRLRVTSTPVNDFVENIESDMEGNGYVFVEYNSKYIAIFLNATEKDQEKFIALPKKYKIEADLKCINVILNGSIKNKKSQFRWVTLNGMSNFKDVSSLGKKIEDAIK